MKQGGKVLLIMIAALALLGGAAVLIHLHVPQSPLAHLHGAINTALSGAGDNETAELPASVRARAGVAAIGQRWDAAAFAETVSLYTALHRELEWPGLLDAETISYGPDQQQNFDLFRPAQAFSEQGPVFVFLHGNGLGASDWRIPGSEGLLLTHAGRLAATAGGLGVIANYRTGPSVSDSSGAEDIRLLLAWLKQNIADYSGDPDTIVVLAHSEGATHLAGYLFNEQLQLDSGAGIAAAILSSGLFGDAAPELPRLIADYSGEPVPLALWKAEYDTEAVKAGIEAVHERLCAKFEVCPWIEEFEGHNHLSQLLSLGTNDSEVMNAFIRFYHTVR